MNKKVIGILIIFFVAILSMNSINATDLTHHNFDNYFSMKVPRGVDFKKEDDSVYEDGMDFIGVSYLSDNIVISYVDSKIFSEDSASYLYQSTFQSLNPGVTKYYESQEGNLKIFEPTTKDGNYFPMVGLNEGNKFIMIVGDDLDLLKEMGHSANFK